MSTSNNSESGLGSRPWHIGDTSVLKLQHLVGHLCYMLRVGCTTVQAHSLLLLLLLCYFVHSSCNRCTYLAAMSIICKDRLCLGAGPITLGH